MITFKSLVYLHPSCEGLFPHKSWHTVREMSLSGLYKHYCTTVGGTWGRCGLKVTRNQMFKRFTNGCWAHLHPAYLNMLSVPPPGSRNKFTTCSQPSKPIIVPNTSVCSEGSTASTALVCVQTSRTRTACKLTERNSWQPVWGTRRAFEPISVYSWQLRCSKSQTEDRAQEKLKTLPLI